MYLTPKRRQRMVRAHHLRQSGHSLSQSAEILGVSKATVHADLKLLETHWDIVAEFTYDDILLDQIEQLQLRLHNMRKLGPVDLIKQLGLPADLRVDISEMTRLYALHQQSINNAARELRLLLRELRPETRRRADEIIDIELVDESDHANPSDPADLTDGAAPQLPEPEPSWIRLNDPDRSEHTIPDKTQEILPESTDQQNSAEQPAVPIPRNTGRNKPCPCGSNKKRKHCHPQSLAPPQRSAA